MNKIMKFENSTVEMQKIDGVWMFELYSVGMALGQIVTAKGKTYANKKRIDQNAENAEITSVLRNAKPYITESQVYDLMLEARTDKCRAFRKWLTNEVLPELNHTGTYSISKTAERSKSDKVEEIVKKLRKLAPSQVANVRSMVDSMHEREKQDKQLSIYSYFDKTYKGEAVLSVADVEYFTGLDRYRIRKAMKLGTEFMDYYFLKGRDLAAFKGENNNRSSNISEMFIITKSGFELICKTYGIKVETPKLFITATADSHKERRLKTIGFETERAVILENPKIQSHIKEITGYLNAMEALLMLYNSDDLSIESAKCKANSICDIAAAIAGKSLALSCAKLETKIVKY